MGHGWKITDKEVDEKRKCPCGKGFIVTYKIYEECDYPPFERESTESVNECQFCKKNRY